LPLHVEFGRALPCSRVPMYSFHPTCEIRQILRLQVLVCHGSQEMHFLIVAGGQNSSSQMRKCHSADEQLARSVIFLVSALPLQKTTSLADVHIMQVHLRRALFVHILLFHFHLLTRRPSTCCDLPTCCQAKCMRLSGRQEGAAGGAPAVRTGISRAEGGPGLLSLGTLAGFRRYLEQVFGVFGLSTKAHRGLGRRTPAPPIKPNKKNGTIHDVISWTLFHA
jgi:hypothetical protein